LNNAIRTPTTGIIPIIFNNTDPPKFPINEFISKVFCQKDDKKIYLVKISAKIITPRTTIYFVIL